MSIALFPFSSSALISHLILAMHSSTSISNFSSSKSFLTQNLGPSARTFFSASDRTISSPLPVTISGSLSSSPTSSQYSPKISASPYFSISSSVILATTSNFIPYFSFRNFIFFSFFPFNFPLRSSTWSFISLTTLLYTLVFPPNFFSSSLLAMALDLLRLIQRSLFSLFFFLIIKPTISLSSL